MRGAGLAAHTQEALLQSAALQIGLELLLNVLRQRLAYSGSKLTECRIMLLHQLIEQRGFGSVPAIAGRIEKWRRSARSGGVEHEGVPATGGDATDYDVKMSDGLGKFVLFDHKCRALPWTQLIREDSGSYPS
jgi:hypothetical protein